MDVRVSEKTEQQSSQPSQQQNPSTPWWSGVNPPHQKLVCTQNAQRPPQQAGFEPQLLSQHGRQPSLNHVSQLSVPYGLPASGSSASASGVSGVSGVSAAPGASGQYFSNQGYYLLDTNQHNYQQQHRPQHSLGSSGDFSSTCSSVSEPVTPPHYIGSACHGYNFHSGFQVPHVTHADAVAFGGTLTKQEPLATPSSIASTSSSSSSSSSTASSANSLYRAKQAAQIPSTRQVPGPNGSIFQDRFLFGSATPGSTPGGPIGLVLSEDQKAVQPFDSHPLATPPFEDPLKAQAQAQAQAEGDESADILDSTLSKLNLNRDRITPPPSVSSGASTASLSRRSSSFLHVETTEDKFPILVRRESGAGTSDLNKSRRPSFSSAVNPPVPLTSTIEANSLYSDWRQPQHTEYALHDEENVFDYEVRLYQQQLEQKKRLDELGHAEDGNFQQMHYRRSSYFQPSTSGASGVSGVPGTPGVSTAPGAPGTARHQSVGHVRSESNFVCPTQPVGGTIPHQRSSSTGQLMYTMSSIVPDTNPTQEPGATGGATVGSGTAGTNGSKMRSVPETGAGIGTGNANAGGFNNSSVPQTNSRRRVSGGKKDDSVSRFTNASLESFTNEIFLLCQDQHGCRFLQKKLEERGNNVDIIFRETCPHLTELMVDPFGNYLCQKLLEYTNDEQRTMLVKAASPSMVKIALNQHGTRALQKMIDFLSTKEQVKLVVDSLKGSVVELIKDLNGNHVVQKCLSNLSQVTLENGELGSQFIFDTVSKNCITVGTHRHGCCVLQRCIDYATEAQQKELINEIIANALTLVQDPFGNYVTQYVLDLGKPKYCSALVERFLGHTCALSMQKFSSNVIEKSLRSRHLFGISNQLIIEIVESNNLEMLLRDSFANYVIQTCLDYALPDTRQRLVEKIRPILPVIRSTPYGRRIQSKLGDK